MRKQSSTYRTAFLGLMLGMILVLTILELHIPPIPFLPPHMKPGLANIVAMYCVFFVGRTYAIALTAGKAAFIFLIRGPIAGVLSLTGGMLPILLVILLVYLFKDKISYVIISILSAITHNLGQYLAISLILAMPFWVYYLPILLVSGVILGSLTGTLLKVLIPVFQRLHI